MPSRTGSRADKQAPARIETQASALAQGFPRGLGQPALRALIAANLTSLERVATASESELLALHGMGPKALRILRDALKLRGLNFAD